MAKDRLETKEWMCVLSSSKRWILCHRKKKPLESVSIENGKKVKELLITNY